MVFAPGGDGFTLFQAVTMSTFVLHGINLSPLGVTVHAWTMRKALVTNTLTNAVRTIFDHLRNGQKSFVRRSQGYL